MCPEQPQVSPTARLTTSEAAELLGVRPRTVHHYIAQGRLKAQIVERRDKDGNLISTRYRILGRDLVTFWRLN